MCCSGQEAYSIVYQFLGQHDHESSLSMDCSVDHLATDTEYWRLALSICRLVRLLENFRRYIAVVIDGGAPKFLILKA